MSVAVTFVLSAVAATENGKALRVTSSSNFAIDREKAEKSFVINYDVNDVSSGYVRDLIASYKIAADAEITVVVDSRFRDVFPFYVNFVTSTQTTQATQTKQLPDKQSTSSIKIPNLPSKQPSLLTKQQMTMLLRLADWLHDDNYIDYVVQAIFDSWTNVMMTAVYFDFLILQLQSLVFTRAPYFLLPPSWIADLVFMKSWFARHRSKIIVVDKTFYHYVNLPMSVKSSKKDV